MTDELMNHEGLRQLPNKDLWRGYRPQPQTANIEPARQLPPSLTLDTAMEAVKAAQQGAKELTCLWCGQQFPTDGAMRQHIGFSHRSVIEPKTDTQSAQMALAALNAKK